MLPVDEDAPAQRFSVRSAAEWVGMAVLTLLVFVTMEVVVDLAVFGIVRLLHLS